MASQSRLLIFTLVFLQVFLLAFANINTGSTLTTNDNREWLSPSGEFAFGFRQLNGTSTSNFSVAIWYNNIPDKTVVWYAKSNNDLAEAPAGSQFQLTSEGLKLTTPQGVSIWTAQPDAVVSYGAMLDTGNFVLVDGESKHVWETFQNPTDTLLPNQSLQLDLQSNLTSRFTKTNYTRGRFQLYFQDGNVLLSPLAWPSTKRYADYCKIDASGSASRLVFDASGDVYVTTKNETKAQPQGANWDNNLTLDPKLNYYRATLDFYGVFTQYAHPRDNTTALQGWTILRHVPDNICTEIFNEVGSGSCGYNSYCSIDTGIPTCKCPDGFTLVDSSNQFGGCQSNFTFVCGADAGPEQELYQLPESTEINFPLGDYASLAPYSQQECQQSCLQDCMCAVVIYTGATKTCWKKSLPLINGRAEKTGSQFIFVKRRVGPLTNYDLPTCHGDSKKALLGSLIGSLLVSSILLLATVVLFILLKKPKRIVQAVSLLETNLHSFTYEVLKNATGDFSEELGRGSFGIVYKGTLESVVVAVKRLDRLAQEREKEFKTEVSAIGKTCHKNLVRLIGFCDEGVNRLLVYEFMSNGTLADVLFGQHKPIWNVRVGFALGIARGLVYLHEECDAPIIHCDIKPQNILIDEIFTAKISDFGLAKLLLSDQSRTNTMIRGTKGYVAPEWFKNVAVTAKVDVYSFGAMLLEIICCRRSVLPLESGEEHKAILTDWAYDCCIKGRIDVLVENDHEALADNGRLQKWVKIAIWCIQEHPEMRPTMRMVIQMLEGVVEVPDPQIPYSFS